MSAEQGNNQHTLYNIANDQLHQDGHQVETDNCTLYPDTQKEEKLDTKGATINITIHNMFDCSIYYK